MTALDRSAAALGRTISRLALAAAALGVLAFLLGLALGRPRAAFAALDASWLFFAGLSAGAVALAAAVRVAGGGWARPVLPLADASVAFFPPAFVLLVVLLLGVRTLLPSSGEAAPGLAAIVVRQLASAVAVFGIGAAFVAAARDPRAPAERVRGLAVAYVVVYAIGLSFWVFDLVMQLSEAPPYTVLPPYYFLGAFLSGLAWVALVAAVRDVSGPDLRHDLGKLLFAFIVVWSYLLWSLFLPTWYGNVPEESAELLRRWRGPYRPITAAVLVAVFAWPFWLLFSERLKRRRTTLALGAGTILLGLWAERFLLVVPSVAGPAEALSVLVGAGTALGVAGLFVLSVGSALPQTSAEAGGARRA